MSTGGLIIMEIECCVSRRLIIVEIKYPVSRTPFMKVIKHPLSRSFLLRVQQFVFRISFHPVTDHYIYMSVCLNRSENTTYLNDSSS